MYRTGARIASRQALGGVRSQTLQAATRRFASTSTPANRPRTWKSSALRWGLAVGAVYYYNTSSVFADEASAHPIAAPSSFADSDPLTVDAVIEQKRKQPKAEQQSSPAAEKKQSELASREKSQPNTEAQNTAIAPGSPEALEEEAGQEGAFNPETGEINWDCPCLGGMAHGPCGEEFKTAFSCFVYSTEEPKGMDCIDKFQGMQECFRQYPDIYGAELSDDDEAGEEPVTAADDQYQVSREDHDLAALKEGKAEAEKPAGTKAAAEGGIPKEWEDASDATPKEVKSEQPAKKAIEDQKE